MFLPLAPVTVEDLLGWPVSMIFTLKRVSILELARGGLVTLIATLLLVRQALTLRLVTLCVRWTFSLRLCFVSSLIAWVLLISPGGWYSQE